MQEIWLTVLGMIHLQNCKIVLDNKLPYNFAKKNL